MPVEHLPPSLSLVALLLVLLVSPLASLASAIRLADSSLAERADPARLTNHLRGRQTTPSSDDDHLAAAEGVLTDTSYLPAQIGGIVGAYAFSLVLVAITLLLLAKKRREHLDNGHDEIDFAEPKDVVPGLGFKQVPPPINTAVSPAVVVPNFSYPSPSKGEFELSVHEPGSYYVYPSPVSTIGAPGIDPQVDQRIVQQDRAMAQDQLEEMYKHVMEQEEAKRRGIAYDAPTLPTPTEERVPSFEKPTSSRTTLTKKKSKPSTLSFSSESRDEKPASKTPSFFSALRSPRNKPSMKAINISSPIMTPQSATFPRPETREMSAIPPRQYNPAAPPPVPTDQPAYSVPRTMPITPPETSPMSTMTIDQRIESQMYSRGNRLNSQAPSEREPDSAISEHSQSPLVGLPSSPKPGQTSFNLPTPRASSFSRPNAPSAVRTNGALPLRAYENADSPSITPQTTKQTTFERKGTLLSPMTGRMPMTAGGTPYSPYQPFTPCVPMTPSLVTREDRKRMKRLMPKTPTVEMVRSSEDIW